MTNDEERGDDIPHEHRAKLSNMLTGKAKEVLGRLTHEDDLVAEGRMQEEVAADDVQPDLDDDIRDDDIRDDGPAPADPA
jgi:uncharacterized protein YjbJ (UPF0337 family)